MIRSISLRILLPSLCVGLLPLGCSKRTEVVHYEYVEPAHTCSVGCHDHYYVDQNVIYVTGHRHTTQCGHYWDGHCWRMNRAARLNPRPYSSGRIHPDDRHGHYNRPKPRHRDRYDGHNDNGRRDLDNRNIGRQGGDRNRQSGRIRNDKPQMRQEKVSPSTRQKRASDPDNESKGDEPMGRKRSSDSNR
jgi:hypothetical protein